MRRSGPTVRRTALGVGARACDAERCARQRSYLRSGKNPPGEGGLKEADAFFVRNDSALPPPPVCGLLAPPPTNTIWRTGALGASLVAIRSGSSAPSFLRSTVVFSASWRAVSMRSGVDTLASIEFLRRASSSGGHRTRLLKN